MWAGSLTRRIIRLGISAQVRNIPPGLVGEWLNLANKSVQIMGRDGQDRLALLLGQIKSSQAGATLTIEDGGSELVVQQGLGDNGIKLVMGHKDPQLTL